MTRAALLAVVLLAACSRGQAPTPAPAARDEVHRFALGTSPTHCLPALAGEAPSCCYEFTAGPALARDPEPRLVAEGRFDGTCGGRSFAWHRFESVKVAQARIALVASKTQLIGNTPLDQAPLLLDARHPDWHISLLAFPLDAGGQRLEVGRFTGGRRGYATWTMRPGCERIVRAIPFEQPGEGFARPADTIQLAPVSEGSCTLAVDYLGAKVEATVRVR